MEKINYNGEVKWQKSYDLSSGEVALEIHQTDDGGYIVGGWSYDFVDNSGGILVLKLDKDGSLEWQKMYGSAFITNGFIAPAHDGYIITGGTNVDHALVVIKTNAVGDIVWQKQFPISVSAFSEHKFPARGTSDGGYVITAYAGTGNL